MSETEYPQDWDQIPEYEEPEGSGGWGPGIGEDLPLVKWANLIGDKIAVVGFQVLPSTYPKDDGTFGDYAQIEFIDKSGEHFLTRTSGKAVLDHLKFRFEHDQVPFRATVGQKPNKSGTKHYNILIGAESKT